MAGPPNPPGKRRPPWLARKDVDAFLMQQDHYDNMLKAEGFNDIEAGRDIVRIPLALHTTPNGHGLSNQLSAGRLRKSHSAAHWDRRWDQRETGELWSAVAGAVARLPRRHPRRRFFVLLVEHANLAKAAREAGITYEAGRWAFRRLLDDIGLRGVRLHAYPERRGAL